MGGVKKSENFADVIYGRSLAENQFSGKTYLIQFIPAEAVPVPG